MTDPDRDLLKAMITVHEGKKTRVYDDATGQQLQQGETLRGKLTGGIGFNFSDRPIPEAVISLLYEICIDEVLADLETFPWWAALDSVRQRAFADLRFNLGPAKFRGFPKLLAAATVGDWKTVGIELLDSQWATQVQPARRARLFQMLTTGVDA